MGTRNSKKSKELIILDEMIAEITVDAYGDDEQLWAFRQAFEDEVALPADGFLIGEPVSVIAIDYDGNQRRGLTAKCSREDGSEYVIAVSEVVLPQTSAGARYIAAYRRWLGLDLYPSETRKSFRSSRQHKATGDDIDPSKPVEMEQVLPGEDPDDPFNDPITRSNDLKDAGELAAAKKVLMDLCQADLRCLDAHSHLGHFVFGIHPQVAVQHYEVGLRIGELSLGDDFSGVLPWGLIDNRPFLRCMHGYGLCLWRLGRFDEAEHIFEKMLWLNPSDNQGVRFIIDAVKEKTAWIK